MKLKTDVIKLRLKELGKTQEDLGKVLGNKKNPRQTGNNIIRRGTASEETAYKIAEFLHCTVHDIQEPYNIQRKIELESERINKLETNVRELKIQLTSCEAMGRTKDELIDVLRMNRDILTRDLNDCRKELDGYRIENARLEAIIKKKK